MSSPFFPIVNKSTLLDALVDLILFTSFIILELNPPHKPLLDVIAIISKFFDSLFSNKGLVSSESVEEEIFFISSESLLEYGRVAEIES